MVFLYMLMLCVNVPFVMAPCWWLSEQQQVLIHITKAGLHAVRRPSTIWSLLPGGRPPKIPRSELDSLAILADGS